VDFTTERATDCAHRVSNHIGRLLIDELQALIDLIETTPAALGHGGVSPAMRWVDRWIRR
jgi:hypothetical protein